MSAELLAFPTPPRATHPVTTPRGHGPGDMVVLCVNATLDLWCAWPVSAVDDDGVVIAVETATGRVVGADRVNCLPDVYGFRAADHQADAFAALRWKTWRDPGDALLAFAAIGAAPPP